MATRSVRAPEVSIRETPSAHVLGDAVERHAGEQVERRNTAAGTRYVTIEQSVYHYESARAGQEPGRREPRTALLERFLEEIEAERGDERTAGEG
jgi:hypothetical protein